MEWCTSSENEIHAYKKGLTSRNKKIKQYDLDGNYVKTWDSTRQIEKDLNIFHNTISLCCKGKRNKAGGYIWRYKDTQ